MGTGAVCNGEMDARQLREYVRLDTGARRTLEQYYEQGAVTARGRDRVLKVARTVADLEGEERVSAEHVNVAMSFRDDRTPVEATA